MLEHERKGAKKDNSDDLLDYIEHKPKWMSVDVWNELSRNYWTSDKWNKISTTSRANI